MASHGEKFGPGPNGQKVKIHESAQVGSFFTIKRHVLLFTMARKSHFSPRPAWGVFHILCYHEKQLCRVVVKNAPHGEKCFAW